MKSVEQAQARRLRSQDGLSIKAIATALTVSPSTVSRWVKDVPLSAEEEARLRRANPIFDRQRRGTARASANARVRREAAQAHGRALAVAGDPLHRAGCMLYWAEGARKRNHVVFTNSDPEMLRVFREFLRRCYEVPDERVALTVNVHLNNGLTLDEIQEWWLDRLQLPPASLRRAAVNRVSRASTRKRRTLPYGTVRLAICSTFVAQSIYGAIQEYAAFERPAWLG